MQVGIVIICLRINAAKVILKDGRKIDVMQCQAHNLFDKVAHKLQSLQGIWNSPSTDKNSIKVNHIGNNTTPTETSSILHILLEMGVLVVFPPRKQLLRQLIFQLEENVIVYEVLRVEEGGKYQKHRGICRNQAEHRDMYLRVGGKNEKLRASTKIK